MKRLIIIFMLLLSVQSYGQEKYKAMPYGTKEVLGIRIATVPRLDGWSVCHVFKGALTYEFLLVLGAEPKHAVSGSIAFAILWEIFIDGVQKKFIIFEPDMRGADIADVCFDALGAYLTRCLHAILKLERLKLSIGPSQVQLSINLGVD